MQVANDAFDLESLTTVVSEVAENVANTYPYISDTSDGKTSLQKEREAFIERARKKRDQLQRAQDDTKAEKTIIPVHIGKHNG